MHSEDGGISWIDQENLTSNRLRGVHFTDRHNGWVVGDYGTILHTTNGGSFGWEEIQVDNEVSALHIYPNPSCSNIVIELQTTPSKNTFLILSNINSQQLITQPISEPQTEIDISHLPAGIYIVKVWNDKDVMMQKIIKQ